MAKKKNNLLKTINKFTGIVLLAITVIVIVMGFLPNVVYTSLGKSTSYSGFNAMFGWAKGDGNFSVAFTSFSFMNMLAYLLPIAGLVLALVFGNSKLLALIPIACYIVGAVFLFLVPSFIVYTDVGGGLTALITVSLGYGAIIAGIMSIIGALWLIIKLLLSAKK